LGQRSLKRTRIPGDGERGSHGKRETGEAGEEKTGEEDPAATPPRHDGH